MKKIERPDSTSMVVELKAHVIKDRDEAVNIFSSVNEDEGDQAIVLQRFVAEDSYQPMLLVMVHKPKSGSFTKEYYVSSSEILLDFNFNDTETGLSAKTNSLTKFIP